MFRPSIGSRGGYKFTVTDPKERFHLTILKQVEGEIDFTATLVARRLALTDRQLVTLFLTMPFMTLGVVIAIHWEALRLWIKGAVFGARPPGPQASISLGKVSRPIS